MNDAVVITGIICGTILVICWLDLFKKGRNKK